MSYYENVKIRVIPRSSRNKIDGSIGDRVKIRIKGAPVDGQANEELISFLAKELNKPKSYIQIIYGQNSRDKTLKILCFDSDDLDPFNLD